MTAEVPDAATCCQACARLPDCGAFTWKGRLCYFKASGGWTAAENAGAVSGAPTRAAGGGRKML